MKQKHRRQYGEVSYWESMADLLVGLLLCILLILMLLILYLLRVPENDNLDKDYGNSYAKYYDPNDGGQDRDDGKYEEYDPDDSDGGGGGWGGWGGWGDYEFPGEYDDPDPGAGEGLGMDKAAVYVQVVDGESGRAIKQENMVYELYTNDDVLQTLSVYYPEKLDFLKYDTTEDGVFFLPEKLSFGKYYLHDLTPVQGYDMVGKTNFAVEESHDWDDPLVVTVELFPSRNIIRVQLKDRGSGQKLSGAVFHVIAVEDIVTADGMTRYWAGQTADTIVLDEMGYGESIPLYLGEYRLEQTTIPETYAGLEDIPSVSVQKTSPGVLPAVKQLSQQKTTVNLILSDELYQGKGLPGAVFTLSAGDGYMSRELTTDESGKITIQDLHADTTYRLKQVSTLEGYEKDPAEYLLRVDSRGYIDGNETTELLLNNWVIRASVGIHDRLFLNLVSDMNVALFDSEDTLVKMWNSTAVEQVVEGLSPGEYRIVLNGQMARARNITIQNTSEMQSFYLSVWTTTDIGVLVFIVLVLILVLLTVFYLLRRKRMEQQREKQKQEER